MSDALIGNTTQNCTIPYTMPWSLNSFYPEFEIKRACNGTIVRHLGKEYVFTNVAELCDWLTKQIEAKK